MSKIIKPIVNLNGTSREELESQLAAVSMAARELLAALDNASPNGRDYQLSPVGDFDVARRQHQDRVHSVRLVLSEINEIREAVADDD